MLTLIALAALTGEAGFDRQARDLIAAFAGAVAAGAGASGEQAASNATADAARRSFIRMKYTSGIIIRRHGQRSARFVPEPERVSMKFIE